MDFDGAELTVKKIIDVSRSVDDPTNYEVRYLDDTSAIELYNTVRAWMKEVQEKPGESMPFPAMVFESLRFDNLSISSKDQISSTTEVDDFAPATRKGKMHGNQRRSRKMKANNPRALFPKHFTGDKA